MLAHHHLRMFIRREFQQAARLRKGLLGRHQREFRQPRRELRRLRQGRMRELGCQNPYARVGWFKFLAAGVTSALDANPPHFRPAVPVYFVTLIDRQQRLDLPNFENSEVEIIKRARELHREQLNGFNYIALLDASLYVSARRTFGSNHLVNFHAHALVWGVAREELQTRCKRINVEIRPLLSYATAAQFEQVKPDDLLQMIWYLSKTPYKQYQVGPHPTTKRLRQWDRKMAYVNAVRLYAVLRDVGLNELTFAGGAGSAILDRLPSYAEIWVTTRI